MFSKTLKDVLITILLDVAKILPRKHQDDHNFHFLSELLPRFYMNLSIQIVPFNNIQPQYISDLRFAFLE